MAEDCIFKQLYDALEEVEVHGHQNIKKMNAVQDALLQAIAIVKAEKKKGDDAE